MPKAKLTLHLLCYDIADPERLVKVHRTVRAQGLPLQYSVFLVPATAAAIDSLLHDLAGIIDPIHDDIRCYPLPQRPDLVHYGRQWLSHGIQVLGDGGLDATIAELASASDANISANGA